MKHAKQRASTSFVWAEYRREVSCASKMGRPQQSWIPLCCCDGSQVASLWRSRVTMIHGENTCPVRSCTNPLWAPLCWQVGMEVKCTSLFGYTCFKCFFVSALQWCLKHHVILIIYWPSMWSVDLCWNAPLLSRALLQFAGQMSCSDERSVTSGRRSSPVGWSAVLLGQRWALHHLWLVRQHADSNGNKMILPTRQCHFAATWADRIIILVFSELKRGKACAHDA